MRWSKSVWCAGCLMLVLLVSAISVAQEQASPLTTVTLYRVDVADNYLVIDDTIYYLAPRVIYNGNALPAAAVFSQLRAGMVLRIEAERVSGQNRIVVLQTRF